MTALEPVVSADMNSVLDLHRQGEVQHRDLMFSNTCSVTTCLETLTALQREREREGGREREREMRWGQRGGEGERGREGEEGIEGEAVDKDVQLNDRQTLQTRQWALRTGGAITDRNTECGVTMPASPGALIAANRFFH